MLTSSALPNRLLVRPYCWILAAAICIISFAPLHAQERVSIIDAAGREFSGTLQKIANRRIEITTDKSQQLAIEDVVRIEFSHRKNLQRPTVPLIVLSNDDRLAVEPVELADERMFSVWPNDLERGVARVPLEFIRGIIWNAPADRELLIQTLYAWKRNDDVIVLRNGDQLTGELTGLAKAKLAFETSVGSLDIPEAGIRYMAMSAALTENIKPTELFAILLLDDGSRMSVQELIWDPGERLICSSLFGAAQRIPINEIAAIQIVGGRAVYLSDLEPANFEFTPYLSRQWPLGLNRNAAGGPIRLRGREFPKGLGMHSRSEVTYELGGDYRQFFSTVGIDDGTAGAGSVVFSVTLDGKPAYNSQTLTGRSVAELIQPIDLQGVNRLTLTVDYGDFGDMNDHAVWCNPVLLK